MENILGNLKTREEVLQEIKGDFATYCTYLEMKPEFREQFMEFCMGIRGVKMCYDPFFKHIFDVKLYPERLSDFLSQIIGEKVEIMDVLPKEHRRISEKGSLLILDIIVILQSGELADVEIQKVGYYFPGQRAACYSSDMVMRQYERVRSRAGKNFSYKDLKKVYTIVIMEKSSQEFKKHPNHYIHRGKWNFDTGLKVELLQEFIFVSLDIFLSLKDNENIETMDELDAWLYFLGSDKPADIQKVILSHPKFEKMYEEIRYFRYHPEEAIQMFSEALRILDENTVKYMIEEMKQELEEAQEELGHVQEELDDVQEELDDVQKELADSKKELADSKKELADKEKEIERLKKLLAEK